MFGYSSFFLPFSLTSFENSSNHLQGGSEASCADQEMGFHCCLSGLGSGCFLEPSWLAGFQSPLSQGSILKVWRVQLACCSEIRVSSRFRIPYWPIPVPILLGLYWLLWLLWITRGSGNRKKPESDVCLFCPTCESTWRHWRSPRVPYCGSHNWFPRFEISWSGRLQGVAFLHCHIGIEQLQWWSQRYLFQWLQVSGHRSALGFM